MKNKIPAVFFDRDGTLIHEAHYLKELKDLKLYDNTAESIKKLNEKGIPVIMVSNQSGVARGYFDEENVKFLNKCMNEMLIKDDSCINGFYYCPHHPKGTVEEYAISCDCRKPLAGMINQALKDFPEIDIKKSYVVGDKECDIELARNSGCKSILVRTGHGSKVDEKECSPDFVANEIKQAVDWILENI